MQTERVVHLPPVDPITACYSRHAQERSQQRAIPPMVVDLLLDFGTSYRSGSKDVYALDKEGRTRLRRTLGERCYRRIEDRLDCWVVLGDDGTVVSIGHRSRPQRSRH